VNFSSADGMMVLDVLDDGKGLPDWAWILRNPSASSVCANGCAMKAASFTWSPRLRRHRTGTRVRVRIPLENPVPEPERRLKMLKVLIVDDHPLIRKGLRQILVESVHIGLVEEASDGFQALEAARKDRFDVIVLDISLPGKDGMEVLRELKELHLIPRC
jgi:PleD family two-component response regulator